MPWTRRACPDTPWAAALDALAPCAGASPTMARIISTSPWPRSMNLSQNGYGPSSFSSHSRTFSRACLTDRLVSAQGPVPSLPLSRRAFFAPRIATTTLHCRSFSVFSVQCPLRFSSQVVGIFPSSPPETSKRPARTHARSKTPPRQPPEPLFGLRELPKDLGAPPIQRSFACRAAEASNLSPNPNTQRSEMALLDHSR